MTTRKQVLIHQPATLHILPTHELSARRTRKFPPAAENSSRSHLTEPPRTGRRTHPHPGALTPNGTVRGV